MRRRRRVPKELNHTHISLESVAGVFLRPLHNPNPTLHFRETIGAVVCHSVGVAVRQLLDLHDDHLAIGVRRAVDETNRSTIPAYLIHLFLVLDVEAGSLPLPLGQLDEDCLRLCIAEDDRWKEGGGAAVKRGGAAVKRGGQTGRVVRGAK